MPNICSWKAVITVWPLYSHRIIVPSSSALENMVPRLFHLTQFTGPEWFSSSAKHLLALASSLLKSPSMRVTSFSKSLFLCSFFALSSGVSPCMESSLSDDIWLPSSRISASLFSSTETRITCSWLSTSISLPISSYLSEITGSKFQTPTRLSVPPVINR